MEHLSVLSSSKMHPCVLISPRPSSKKGACFCCLKWIWMWGAVVRFTPLVWNPLRASDTCTLQGTRDLGHSGLSLSVYSHVNYLTIPSCNPQPYSAELHSILILMGYYKTPGYLPVLTDILYFDFDNLLFLCVYCLFFLHITNISAFKILAENFAALSALLVFVSLECECIFEMGFTSDFFPIILNSDSGGIYT